MKSIIICSLLLISCTVLQAQDNYVSGLPQYISKAGKPYYADKLQWFTVKPDMGFISLRKLKGKVPPFGRQKIPNFISKASLPYFEEQHCWLLYGIWKDSVKTAATRRKEYGRRYYFTLTKLFDKNDDKSALPKTVNALADLRFTINQQQQFELLDLLGRYCMKYRLWDEAEKYYRDELTEQLLTPGFFDYAPVALKLADALIKQEKYSEAGTWIDFSKSEYKNSGNAGGMALCYIKEAEISICKNKLTEAETLLLTKALPYFTRADSNEGRMACFEKLGQVYLLQKRFSEAKWFFLQQYALSRTLNDRQASFHSLVNLSTVKTAIKDYKLAASDLTRAKNFLKNNQSPELNLSLEEAYMKLYTAQGNKKLKGLSADKCQRLKSLINEAQISKKDTAMNLLKSTRKETQLLTAIQTSAAVKVEEVP